ncbi:hypothetical protein V1498_08280 [Peribacillus sp. SCS-26]
MQKKYCEHCRAIYSKAEICEFCGRTEMKPIIIEVQSGEKNRE